MKTTKFFFMAALALTFAACSNDDNDIALQPAEQAANGEITITATVSSDEGATNRALSIDGSNIASTWKLTDQFAILFNDGTNDVKRTATVSSIQGSSVTITFTIPGSLASNTACTIVYPASAANATNTGADVNAALATQNGKIETTPEVRVGTATIDKTTHSLTSVTKLTAQNAIFKFTLKDIAGTSDKAATEFIVKDGSNNVITTVTPAAATNELYVALPALATGTYWFNATVDSKPYIAKATTTDETVAGKYYSSTVKMATFGDFILSDGKFAPSSSAGTKVAMIVYVGSDAETNTTYNHGLALALSDVSTSTYAWCSQKASTCLTNQYTDGSDAKTDMAGIANTDALVVHGTHTHAAAIAARNYNSGTHPTGTSAWFLPSAGQWDKMATAASGYNNLGLLSGNNYYWSSSEKSYIRAWYFKPDNGSWHDGRKDDVAYVRACLAF